MTVRVDARSRTRIREVGLEWKEEGLCAQTDPEVFFPDKGESPNPAKRICAKCHVEANCLEWALRNNEPYGVWGGTSEKDRKKIKAAQRSRVLT